MNKTLKFIMVFCLSIVSMVAMCATSTPEMDGTRMSQEVREILVSYEARISERCAAEYRVHYTELKEAHERFMGYVNGFLVMLGIWFTFLGVGVAWYGIINPRKKLKTINAQWKDMKQNVEQLRKEASFSVEQIKSSKAELYFQLARMGFAQYKIVKDSDVLEAAVKFLSQCIKLNVEIKNALGTKSAIAFLNAIMNKEPSKLDGAISETILQDRKTVANSLRKWNWGVTENELEKFFDNSEVDEECARWSVMNFKKVVSQCREGAFTRV